MALHAVRGIFRLSADFFKFSGLLPNVSCLLFRATVQRPGGHQDDLYTFCFLKPCQIALVLPAGYRRREDREDGYERPISKADTASDWGAERKFVPSDGPSRGGGGFGGGGFGGGGSRDREGGRGFDERPPRREYQSSAADEVDNWGSSRKFVPSTDEDRRGGGGGGGFGGGFRDRDGPREGGFRDRDGPREGVFKERPRYDEPSRADGGDWGTRRGPEAGAAGSSDRNRGFGFSGEPTAADSEDRWSRRGPPAESSGAAAGSSGPSERPRLNLKPRSKPAEVGKPTASGAATPESEEAAAAAGEDGVGVHGGCKVMGMVVISGAWVLGSMGVWNRDVLIG